MKPCFTPVCSLQSNDISEAFVHIIKRDYVRVSPLPDASTAMTSLAGWIEDYNDNHPHSGLKMRSPHEHRKIWTSAPDRFIVNPIHEMPGLNT